MHITSARWTYNDGGRIDAGFRGSTGDCVTRAIAIATGLPYREVYDNVNVAASGKKKSAARIGVPKKITRKIMEEYGFVWTPVCSVGSGVTMHLIAAELPSGTIITKCSKHVVAVIDGVCHDTFDPTRGGRRAVYGYWIKDGKVANFPGKPKVAAI